MVKRFFIFMLYVIYALVLVGVLLVVLFPRDRFLIWVADRVERELPGFECRVDDVRYVHPFQVRFHQILLDNKSEQINIPIDTLQIGFEKKWPIDRFDFSAALYGGVVESDVRVDLQSNQVDFANLSATSIRLDEIDFIQKRIDRQIRGGLNLSGKMSVKTEMHIEPHFTGIIELENVYTKLRRPVLETSEIELQQIETNVDLGLKRINLSGGRFTGTLLNGKFSGSIILQKPWQQSRMDIEGGVIPQTRFLQSDPVVAEAAAKLYRKYREDEIPYLIEGSIQEPLFKFGKKKEVRVKRAQ